MTKTTSSTHIYTGPDTRYGLKKGSKCRILGNRAGGKLIFTEDNKHWLVAPQHLEKIDGN